MDGSCVCLCVCLSVIPSGAFSAARSRSPTPAFLTPWAIGTWEGALKMQDMKMQDMKLQDMQRQSRKLAQKRQTSESK